jgi:hypothetical protein
MDESKKLANPNTIKKLSKILDIFTRNISARSLPVSGKQFKMLI